MTFEYRVTLALAFAFIAILLAVIIAKLERII